MHDWINEVKDQTLGENLNNRSSRLNESVKGILKKEN